MTHTTTLAPEGFPPRAPGRTSRETPSTLSSQDPKSSGTSPLAELNRARAPATRERLSFLLSGALAVTSTIAASSSFWFWGVFHRDAPQGVGNMRGTALTILLLAIPLLVGSMLATARGSLRARFVWLSTLAYLTYNAVLFLFAAHFNSYFLLFTTMLALCFWSLVSLLSSSDVESIDYVPGRAKVRITAVYLLACMTLFAAAWLQVIVPATLDNQFPGVLDDLKLTQNVVWVLDFSFTFPLMGLGAVWLWRRTSWGYVIGGTMVTMLTLETAGIALDQYFGHLHDPTASLSAVPIMVGFTVVGVALSIWFLKGVRRREGRTEDDPAP